MLTATSQIVHINPHLSGTLERQDLNTVLSFIPHICYEIMSPPDIPFSAFQWNWDTFFQKDWQIGSKQDLAEKCECVCAVKQVNVTNMSFKNIGHFHCKGLQLIRQLPLPIPNKMPASRTLLFIFLLPFFFFFRKT